ncbi:unnamed protein product [Aphanomyces euteiches]|uniref:Complex 1 LYR protein domain-containing protein n=1 Tax=Aphanomyces euteiches TaxID=100861 RepID=A0A6G0WRK1_9STRA|nr:hypothetical protein Ae201684_012395 [Aphanomyces euteiches]KAH9090531.1 hypothetical protein Ae201684P_014331 [Aphanomyces euteiches]KAH9135567.1 hypothetical protein AeRB84_019055 [Aphanomyces euteiches]
MKQEATLSFAYFVNRSQVLKQYRLFLREIRPLQKDTRREVQQTIRAKFDAVKHEKDSTQIKKHLAYGHAQMQHVRELVNSASSFVPRVPSDTWTDAKLENLNESQEDIKGRLGKGWPWTRK